MMEKYGDKTWGGEDISTGLALHQQQHLVTRASHLEHLVRLQNVEGVLHLQCLHFCVTSYSDQTLTNPVPWLLVVVTILWSTGGSTLVRP